MSLAPDLELRIVKDLKWMSAVWRIFPRVGKGSAHRHFWCQRMESWELPLGFAGNTQTSTAKNAMKYARWPDIMNGYNLVNEYVVDLTVWIIIWTTDRGLGYIWVWRERIPDCTTLNFDSTFSPLHNSIRKINDGFLLPVVFGRRFDYSVLRNSWYKASSLAPGLDLTGMFRGRMLTTSGSQ